MLTKFLIAVVIIGVVKYIYFNEKCEPFTRADLVKTRIYKNRLILYFESNGNYVCTREYFSTNSSYLLEEKEKADYQLGNEFKLFILGDSC